MPRRPASIRVTALAARSLSVMSRGGLELKAPLELGTLRHPEGAFGNA
jgi:hypothetical protein